MLKVVFYISDVIMQYKTMLDTSGFASGAQRMNSQLGEMGMRTNAASASLGPLGTVLGSMASPLSMVALGATAVGGALMGSVQAAAAWESSMTGVAKTTGMAGPELAALSQELLTMSTNIPLAASELASIAQAGGSLGIAKEELAGFTEVAAQMGVGFEMAADEAATAGAKILNAFGKEMNTENLRSLGSVVNTMGDSFAATEPQVLDFLNRAAFLNTTMGQSIPQVAALGTTLISAGLSSETAATGIKSMLNMLTSETSKTGGIDNWAQMMGVSVEELKEKVATDLNSTLIETANTIAAMEDPTERFQEAVKAAGTEGAPALLKLAGQQENYTKALGMTNAEWEKASSLQKTFDAQSGTMNSQWQMFTNTITLAATELGTVLLPSVTEGISFMTDLAKVSIKVGEAIYDLGNKAWDALKPLRDMWDSTPMRMIIGAAGDVAGGAWDSLKEWAGLGTDRAEQMAKEISENEKLQTAGEEAIKAGQEAGVLAAGEVGRAAGEESGKEYADAIKATLSRQAAGVSIAQVNMYEEGLKAIGKQALVTGTGKEDWKSGGWRGEATIDSMKLTSVWTPTSGGGSFDIYSEDSQGTKTLVGHVPVTSNFNMPSGQELAAMALAQSNITGSESELLRLANKPLEAMVLEQQLKLETQIDLDIDWGAIKMGKLENPFGLMETPDMGIGSKNWMRDILEKYVADAGEEGEKAAQTYVEDFAKSLANPSFDLLGSVEQQAAEIRSTLSDPIDQAGLDSQMEQYTNTLISRISDSGKFLKSELETIGKDANSALEDGMLSGEEQKNLMGYEPQLRLLKAAFPKEFDAIGGESALALIDALKAGDIPGAAAIIGKMSGEAFKTNLLGGAALEAKSLTDLIGDPAALKAAAVDQTRFWEGTMLPAIKRNADEAKAAFDSGQFTQQQVYDNYIKPMSTLTDYIPKWMDELNSMFKSGRIDPDDYVYLLDEMTKKTDEAVTKSAQKTEDASKKQIVGYDNLKAAIGDCNEAMSEFGSWQESQAGMFQGSYIGQGGQEYLDWKTNQVASIAETQRAMKAAGGAVLGQDYTQSPLLEQQIKIGADMSGAELAKTTFEQAITSSRPEMALLLNTSIADMRLQNFYNMVESLRPTMSVQVDVSANANQIYNMVSAAIAEALS